MLEGAMSRLENWKEIGDEKFSCFPRSNRSQCCFVLMEGMKGFMLFEMWLLMMFHMPIILVFTYGDKLDYWVGCSLYHHSA